MSKSFKIDEKVLDEISELSRETNIPRSTLIATAWRLMKKTDYYKELTKISKDEVKD